MISIPNRRASINTFFCIYVAALLVFFVILTALLSFIESQSVGSSIWFAAVNGLFFWVCLWVLFLIGGKSRRRQRTRNDLRQRGLLRSPWGEKRTTDPQPFADRLTAFTAAHELAPDNLDSDRLDSDRLAADDQQIDGKAESLADEEEAYQSTMSFWSIVDVPREIEPPKPVWFLRRILLRIQNALHGYR